MSFSCSTAPRPTPGASYAITGGGVIAGIDFALVCAAELARPVEAQLIQLIVEYAPAPPFDSGRPELAPEEVMKAFQTLVAGQVEAG